MKPSLSLKTLYRSPVRMVLTFILLVAVTFTLFSQVLEHAVTVREIDKAAEQYDGVGAVEVLPVEAEFYGDKHTYKPFYVFNDDRVGKPVSLSSFYMPAQYELLENSDIDKISKMYGVTSVDTRYMTAGVSNEYVRLDDGDEMYNFTAQCLVEGTLTSVSEDLVLNGYVLVFADCKLLSGEMDKKPNGIVRINTHNDNTSFTYVFGRMLSAITEGYPYKEDFIKTLNIGSRYAFVTRYEPNFNDYKSTTYTHELGDIVTETWANTFWGLDGAPDNWLETEEYAEAKQVAEMIDLNHHTFDMVYTDDMSSIMRFANGSMMIAEGRGIEPDDSLNNPNICVVSREFAIANDLVVGDEITMQLGDKLFEQYASLGATPLAPARVSENYTEETLKIVGIYSNVDSDAERSNEPHWVYSYNAIFVPKALLNVSEAELEDHRFAPGEFSFKVADANDISVFLEDSAPVIEEMGLTLIFEDQNWLDIASGFEATKELAVIKIGVLSAAVVIAIWFSAMLYITGRRKDYSVMRLLGTSVKKSNRAMSLPFMTLTVFSVIVGAILSWISTNKTIAQSNSMQMLAGFTVDTSVPFEIVILCAVIEIIVTFVIAILMLFALGKKSPLVLMQNSDFKRKKDKDVIEETAIIEIKNTDYVTSVDLQKHKKYGRRFVLKYVFRHIRRTTAKSLLTVLLAVLLINTVAQLDIMIDSYTELVKSTEVTSNFIGGLELGYIDELETSGYVSDVYYVANSQADVNNIEAQLIITNDIERYAGDTPVEIQYMDGFEYNSVSRQENLVVISSQYAETHGLKCGDTVLITPHLYMRTIQHGFVSRHREEKPDDTRSDSEILALYSEEMIQTYNETAVKFTVVGIFTVMSDTPSTFDNAIFTPGTMLSSDEYGKETMLGTAEATVADNNLADEYREFGEELAGGSVTEGVMFVMDTSKLENLRNTLRLVEMLYPIAVVVTLVIGAFLCGLIIVQTSKDIAIMRVLGTSKAKTRTILVLEQMILCVIGIVIAGAVLFVRGALVQMLWVFGAYAGVILLASIIASIAASRKNVLELLQTKE